MRPATRDVEITKVRSRAIDTGFERLGEANIRCECEHEGRKHDCFTELLHDAPPYIFRQRASTELRPGAHARKFDAAGAVQIVERLVGGSGARVTLARTGIEQTDRGQNQVSITFPTASTTYARMATQNP